MYKRKKVAAVILAGGTGSRMGTSGNKVYLPLLGRSAIFYGIEAFAKHPYVDELVFVTREEEWAEAEALLRSISPQKPWRIVCGGESRQVSVYNGIQGVESEFVLIHDGARPLVSQELIGACVEALVQYKGAVPGLSVKGDIYRGGKWGAKPERMKENLYAVQTPQGFHTQILRACHEKYRDNPNSTDDSCLLELEGHKVGIVAGDPQNIKLTTPLDLSIAETHLRGTLGVDDIILDETRARILKNAKYYLSDGKAMKVQN